MYSLASTVFLIPLLLTGGASASPVKARPNVQADAVAAGSWTGSNSIYVIDDGDVNGCLDEAMSWTTEGSCATFWVHPLPGEQSHRVNSIGSLAC
jgi:hypothetical protein